MADVRIAGAGGALPPNLADPQVQAYLAFLEKGKQRDAAVAAHGEDAVRAFEDQMGKDAWSTAVQSSFAPQPSATELAGWANQRSQLSSNYGSTLAQLGFDRSENASQNALAIAQLAERSKAALGDLSARKGLDLGDLARNNEFNTADLTTRFNRMRDQLPGSYARRGVLDSGVYQRGLNQYGEDRTNAFNRMASDYNSNVNRVNTTYGGQEANLRAGFDTEAGTQAYNFNHQQGQNLLSNEQANSSYQTGMNSIDALQAARRQELAAQIRGM